MFTDPYWQEAADWLAALWASHPEAVVHAPQDFRPLAPSRTVGYEFGFLHALPCDALLLHKGMMEQVDPLRRLRLLPCRVLAGNPVFLLFTSRQEIAVPASVDPSYLLTTASLTEAWACHGIPAIRPTLD